MNTMDKDKMAQWNKTYKEEELDKLIANAKNVYRLNPLK